MIDTETALEYGIIKAELRKNGQPIPENDIWISAIAKRHDLVVITRDKHFKQVEHIRVKNW